jgi:hypothetical protein
LLRQSLRDVVAKASGVVRDRKRRGQRERACVREREREGVEERARERERGGGGCAREHRTFAKHQWIDFGAREHQAHRREVAEGDGPIIGNVKLLACSV